MLAIESEVIAGIRCALHDSGPRHTPEAVVFVHGNPGPLDDWQVLAGDAARFARVLAPDMPGFGRSERPRAFSYDSHGYACYLDALLVARGVERVHLVLHDFGCAWGLTWALQHPHKLASLSLINGGIMPGYRWHVFARIWQTPVLGELFQLVSSARAMRWALDRQNPRPLPPGYVERTQQFADWGHKRAVLKLYRASRELDALMPDAGMAEQAALLPTCVIWGAQDPYLPSSYAERQKEFFTSAEVHVLPGLGHWPFIDDPEAVRGPLSAFLRRQVAHSAGASNARAG
jgi:pimeloyl-ACP methyl ester carboxylesterase